MSTHDTVTEMLAASDRGDFDHFRTLLVPDCEWVNPIVQAEGADEIVANLREFSTAFPTRRHDVTLALGSGDALAVEGTWVATHVSGATVRMPFAAMIAARDGRIASVRLYIDTAAFASQLSAPAPA